MLCSFCSKSVPVRIDIESLNLRICPNCFATFLPASQFAELRRVINDSTKHAWIKRLETTTGATLAVPTAGTKLRCQDHNEPLVHGSIPNYGFDGLVPTCCDTQHIPPDLMIKILEMGLGAQTGIGMGGLVGVRRHKANIFARTLGGILFYFWAKKQKPVDDGLDRLQYNYKFKEVLGDWIG